MSVTLALQAEAGTRVTRHLPSQSGDVYAMRVDANGNAWVGTNAGKVFRWTGSSWTQAAFKLNYERSEYDDY